MRLSETNGLKALARSIVDAGEAAQTAVLQFPSIEQQKTWWPHVLEACHEDLLFRRDELIYDEFIVDRNDRNSEALMSNSGADSVHEFLLNFGPDPVAIVFEGEIESDSDWDLFLGELLGLQKSVGPERRSRYILISLVARELPPVLAGATVRRYQLWNPLRWEEARLLVTEQLGREKAEATRCWMVASYTGASNLDPYLMAELCDSRPANVAQIVELVIKRITVRGSSRAGSLLDKVGESDRHWKVPGRFSEAWKDGLVIGATLERGVTQPMETVPADDWPNILRFHIWQEQVAGLLPLVIHLSHRTNRLLDTFIGDDWRHEFANDRSISVPETYYSEPGPIRVFLSYKKEVFVPEASYQLLTDLSKVRNHLAHMRPVEKLAIQRLWDLYKRAQMASERVKRY